MIKLKKEKEKITSHKSTSDRHGIILLKVYVIYTHHGLGWGGKCLIGPTHSGCWVRRLDWAFEDSLGITVTILFPVMYFKINKFKANIWTCQPPFSEGEVSKKSLPEWLLQSVLTNCLFSLPSQVYSQVSISTLFCFPLQKLCIKIQEINIGATAREDTSALLQVTYQVGLCIPQGLEQVFVGQVLGWSKAESSLILLGLVVSAQGSSVSTLPNRASSIPSMAVTLAMSVCLCWHIKCAGLAAIWGGTLVAANTDSDVDNDHLRLLSIQSLSSKDDHCEHQDISFETEAEQLVQEVSGASKGCFQSPHVAALTEASSWTSWSPHCVASQAYAMILGFPASYLGCHLSPCQCFTFLSKWCV